MQRRKNLPAPASICPERSRLYSYEYAGQTLDMASFAFSVGDFVAFGNFAWAVYKACGYPRIARLTPREMLIAWPLQGISAGSEFREVSHEVISLHTAIKELQNEVENTDSILNRTGAGKKGELGVLVRNCNTILQQLHKLIAKYKLLGTNRQRVWDRMRFGSENLQDIREKLMMNTSSLTLFSTTLGASSLGRIGEKLDQLIADVRAGRRKDTVLSIAENAEAESEEEWSKFKAVLVEEGFAKPEIEAHKHWIKAKVRELLDGSGLHFDDQGDLAGGHINDASQSKPIAKESNFVFDAKKYAALQPTVEDDEEDDVQGPGRDDAGQREEDPARHGDNESDIDILRSGFTTSDHSGETPRPGDPVSQINIGTSTQHLIARDSGSKTPSAVNANHKGGNEEHQRGRNPNLRTTPDSSRAFKAGPLPPKRAAFPHRGRSHPEGQTLQPVNPDSQTSTSNTPHDDLSSHARFGRRSPVGNNARRALSQDSRLHSEGDRATPSGYTHCRKYGERFPHQPIPPSERISYLGYGYGQYPWDQFKASGLYQKQSEHPGDFPNQINNYPAFDPMQHTRYTQFPNETYGYPYALYEVNNIPPELKRPTSPEPEIEVVERPLPLTLEELFTGAHKKMKLTQGIFDESGNYTVRDKIVDIDIRPGLKAGTKIKFNSFGHTENGVRQDVHFIVEYKPHHLFKREGDDLHVTVELSLLEALCGWSGSLTTIDGKSVPLSGLVPTQPGKEERYPGLGMPITKKRGERGDMVATIRVRFPSTLSERQKSILRKGLAPEE